MTRVTYRALHLLTGAQLTLRERLTPAGWAVLGAAALGAAIGVDTTRAMTFQAFTFLGVLLVMAVVLTLGWRASVSVQRTLPRYATVGELLEYRATVRNRGRRVLRDALLSEWTSDPRPSFEECCDATSGPDGTAARWRHGLLNRWHGHVQRRTPPAMNGVTVPALAPGATSDVKLAIRPRRRGRLAFAGLLLARTDPLGLVRGLRRLPHPAHVTVLPRRYRLPAIALPGARRYQEGGVALASTIGEAEEFVGLREYRPGDPLQRVHWKSFARTGKPIVKQFQDEFFERHALVLDTSTDRGEDIAFEEAVAVAASFVHAIDTQECLLDLLFVGATVHTHTAGRGQLRAEHLLEVLAGLAASPSSRFQRLAQAVHANRHRLTTCILVLLAWDDARRAFVESLRRSGLQLRVLLVRAEGEGPGEPVPGLTVLHPGAIERGLASLR